MRGQHLRGSGEAPVAVDGHEAAQDRLGGLAVELLVRDRPGERLVRRPAPLVDAARTMALDQAAHHRVAGEVAVASVLAHRGGTSQRYTTWPGACWTGIVRSGFQSPMLKSCETMREPGRSS